MNLTVHLLPNLLGEPQVHCGVREDRQEALGLLVAAGQLDSELESVDRKLRPFSATLAEMRAMRDRIPDVSRPVRGRETRGLTGVRWSGIENRT